MSFGREQDLLLTRQQAADTLRVSVPTVARLLASGALVAYRVGRQWRIPRSAIEEYLSCSRIGNEKVSKR